MIYHNLTSIPSNEKEFSMQKTHLALLITSLVTTCALADVPPNQNMSSKNVQTTTATGETQKTYIDQDGNLKVAEQPSSFIQEQTIQQEPLENPPLQASTMSTNDLPANNDNIVPPPVTPNTSTPPGATVMPNPPINPGPNTPESRSPSPVPKMVPITPTGTPASTLPVNTIPSQVTPGSTPIEPPQQ